MPRRPLRERSALPSEPAPSPPRTRCRPATDRRDPQVADAEHPSGQPSEPGPKRHVVTVQNQPAHLVRVEPVGQHDCGERARVVVRVLAYEVKPPAADRPAGRLRMPGVPRDERDEAIAAASAAGLHQGGDRPGVWPGSHVGEPGPVPRRRPAAVMIRIGPEPAEQLNTRVCRRARTGRAPGSALIAVAAWLLALTGGALFVSFSAQYAYILGVRRQDAASVIEALLVELLMIVFTLLALGLSRAGKSSRARTGPHPGLRRRIVLHERVGRRRGQPAVGRRVGGRAYSPGHGGGPGRGGDPPPRPGRPRALGLDNPGPRRGGRGQDRRAGAAVLATRCGSPWPPRRRPGDCAGWCWTPPLCPRSPGRPRRR